MPLHTRFGKGFDQCKSITQRMRVRMQLLDALAKNTTVTSLDMSGNSVNDEGAEVRGSLGAVREHLPAWFRRLVTRNGRWCGQLLQHAASSMQQHDHFMRQFCMPALCLYGRTEPTSHTTWAVRKGNTLIAPTGKCGWNCRLWQRRCRRAPRQS